MIEFKNVSKVYKGKSEDVVALDSINVSFDNSGMVFVLGESGSGKTTLLNILGGIDKETSGEIYINDISLKDISYEQYRRDIISFVFQDYNLLPKLNVYQNISLLTPTIDEIEKENITMDILCRVGLKGFEKRGIDELSGGQKQRVAIARALAKNCQILLCDEPTGNLDSKNSAEIFDLLKEISKEKLVIVVSHNEEMAMKYGDRVLRIKDGKIEKDEVILEKTEYPESKESNNIMSLKTIIRYGLNNLSSFKFKTIVSCILVVLSMVSLCSMVISLTYSSERINAHLSSNDRVEYIVDNAGHIDSPRNNYGGEILEISSSISDEYRIDGYEFLNSIFYIVDNNEEMLDIYDYYFKEPLNNESCYITDYYLNVCLKNNSYFKISEFNSIEDLAGTEVYYKDVFQYNIAGIIKTDYSKYFTDSGLEKKKYNSPSAEYTESIHKKKCEYNVIFGLRDVCEKATFVKDNILLKGNIEISSGSNKYHPYEVKLLFNESNYKYEFLKNDGYFGSLIKEDGYTNKVTINDNEVVISSCLYNYLFNEEIDWAEFNASYHNNITFGTPLVDEIAHLYETINIVNYDEDRNIHIYNAKIVGVVCETESCIIYANSSICKSSTIQLTERMVSLVDWEKIGNKLWTVESLRSKDLLLSGAKFDVAYSKEYGVQLMSYTFITFAGIFVLFAIFSIINLVIHRINDNKKEIGILFATGCTKLEIVGMYLVSIIFISILSLIISLIILMIACVVMDFIFMVDELGYIWLFYPNVQTILSLLVSLLVIVLISALPLYKYLKKNPIEIIRKAN